MKYIIKSAVPVINKQETQTGAFNYNVSHWDLHVIQWDGICMCTKEEKDIKLNIDGLSYSKKQLIDIIKKGV